MKNELLKTIERTKESINLLKHELKMSKGVLLSHNFVVEVGAFTMCSKWNDERQCKLLHYSNKPYHLVSKWNQNGVDEIVKILKDEGEDREIKVYFYKEYYKEKIERLENFIKSLNGMIKTLS
tara:strand:+ start:269 stop:637 length:369 start_codon:yes stop_codon:yes gene_type:complete